MFDKNKLRILEKLKLQENPQNYVEDPYSSEDMVNEIAEKAGLTPDEIRKVHFIESSEGKMLQNPDSSARGNFQIIDSTRKEIKKQLADRGITDIPVNPLRKDALLTGELFKKYREKLQNRGLEPNLENMYLMHNRGVTGALDALKDPNSSKNKEVLKKVRALLQKNAPSRQPNAISEELPAQNLMDLLGE